MRKIFITDRQFQYILKRLDKSCMYHKPEEEDLEYLEWVNSIISSLSIEIGIMMGGCTSKDEFPVLYFKNKNNNIGIITVSYNPTYLKGEDLLDKHNSFLLKQFIINNVENLYLAGHSSYSTSELFHYLNFSIIDNGRLDEMPLIKPSQSGLKKMLWVDDAETYKMGKHGPRIKFQNTDSRDSRDFDSMTISDDPRVIDMESLNKNKKVSHSNQNTKKGKRILSSKDINLIKQFVIYNEYYLLKLCNKEISFFNDFIPYMYTYNGKNFISHAEYKDTFNKIGEPSYGFSVVKSSDGLYNYFDENNQNIISDVWFDLAIKFDKYGSDISGRCLVNDCWFDIYPNGRLNFIKRK